VSAAASFALGVAGLIAATAAAQAERLTVAVSTPQIDISSNFTGENVTIFGVIEADAGSVPRTNYQVAVVVRGADETVVARRKDRLLGVWLNGTSETLNDVPSFYALAASVPVDRMASEAVLRQYELGFANIGFRYSGRSVVNDPEAEDFRRAFVRLKHDSRLYAEDTDAVSFIGNTVFRSAIWIPANVPVGTYAVRVYIFSGGTLLARSDDNIAVSKTGFEQFMFASAHGQAFAYGLACVILALFTGWLGGVVFRRD
jgi:uncharacterized protein (TIGR02186 family)